MNSSALSDYVSIITDFSGLLCNHSKMKTKNKEIKVSVLDGIVESLSGYLREYDDCFRTVTRDSGKFPELHISGLLKNERGKRGMERLHEEPGMEGNGYQKIQHFIRSGELSGRRQLFSPPP